MAAIERELHRSAQMVRQHTQAQYREKQHRDTWPQEASRETGLFAQNLRRNMIE
jgi:hypothetical protein